MAYYAKLDENNAVIDVLSVHNNELLIDGVESEVKGVEFLTSWSGGYTNWVKTSYNAKTNGYRKNYAGNGYIYDSVRDAFIPPKQFNSWVLDEPKGQWKAPTPMPADGKRYAWDEATLTWKVIL